MSIASIFEDAFLTTLSHSEPQLSIKNLMDIVPFLLKIPREICQGIVGLYACLQRVFQAKPNLLMNVIETQRACWPFHTLDILSFELIVGHVSAVRTRLVTNEDESVAVVCCEGSLLVRVAPQCSGAR